MDIPSNISPSNPDRLVPPKKSLTGKWKGRKFLSVQLALVVVLVLLGGFGIWQVGSTKQVITVQAAEAEEQARAAEISIVVVYDATCDECASLDGYIDAIRQENVLVKNEEALDITEDSAMQIVNTYGINKLPFFIVSGEITKHAALEQLWSSMGIVQNDVFVLTKPPVPFYDLSANRVIGRTTVTYITDVSCEECYDVMNHQSILKNNFLMYLAEEKTVDRNDVEGKELVEKYSITQFPTFVVDSEAAAYPLLLSVWDQVGTIESDGSYIFRKPELMGVYFDSATGEVIAPAVPEEANQDNTR